MQLVGSAIAHKKFGKGVVTGLSEHRITISFSAGEKEFLYPDSFERHLVLKDGQRQAHMEQMLNGKRWAEEEQQRAEQRKLERAQRLRNLKISPNSQVAIGFLENTEEEVFASWSAFAGRYVSGYSKGEPRVPIRIKPNSACLLTERPAGASERERMILGAFMVKDDFYGADCENGQILSHTRFRVRLPEELRMSFWRYFNTADSTARWGNTELKYFSHITMRQILLDMVDVLADSEQASGMEEFYAYFCNINRLSEQVEEPLAAVAE